MNLADIMTRRVVTVEMDDTLDTIQSIFHHARFHHVMVLDEEGHLAGVISDRDLLKALSPFLDTLSERTKDADTLKKKAHQVMSREPVTARPDTKICDAANKLVRRSISCLPVIDKHDEIVGIVTWKDILRRIVCQEPE